MKVKKLAKLMQKYINNPEFMSEIYSSSDLLSTVNEYLATTLEYLICTNGNKLDSPLYNIYARDILDLSKETLQKRIIDNAIMTHSFNGYNLKKVMKYGLGNNNIRDPEIDRCFEILEKTFGSTGISPFTKNQTNTTDEIYMCSPGTKSFYYANAQSPERLYLGILKQSSSDAMPIVIGQTKEEYMLSVANKKIANCNAENKKELYDAAKYLIHSFCTQKPVIALFPVHSKDYNLNVSHSMHQNEVVSIVDQINDNVSQPLDYFSKSDYDNSETNNLGNLVFYGSIPPRDLSFVEVPDKFEILQKIALTRGMKNGDMIDYFTGQEYKPREVKNIETLSNKSHQITKETDVLPQHTNKYEANKKHDIDDEMQM